MPDLTLEQERTVPIAERRSHVPPNPQPVPPEKMQVVKILPDSLSVFIFRPDNIEQDKKLPVIIDYHGGGFFLPLQEWMYPSSYALANELQSVVVSVDYRVAPEHRFPAAVQDCYNTYKWVVANAGSFGGDSNRIMLNGASAGANLATVVSLLAKEDGLDRHIKMVSLFCPNLDNPINATHASYTENAKGYGLTKNNIIWVTENYSSHLAADTLDFRMFPMKAKNLSGLPPTIIYTAEFDLFRDEGAAYAKKLEAAKVPVLFRCFPGQLHVLTGLPPDAKEWEQISNDMMQYMKIYVTE